MAIRIFWNFCMNQLSRFVRFWLMGCWALSACTLAQSADLLSPTPTRVLLSRNSLISTLERDFSAAPIPIPQPTSTLENTACPPTDGLPTVRHQIEAVIDYGDHSVAVEQQITFINRTDEALDTIRFDIEANRFANAFTLYTVTTPHFELMDVNGRQMTLELTEALLPGCTQDIGLEFQLVIPAVTSGISGYTGYFSYSNRQLNLGHWLPTIAVYRDGEWVTHDVTVIGEQTVSEVADWDVRLQVTNAPPNIVVAAPGDLLESADQVWRYAMTASRDFSVSMSPFFRQESAITEAGTKVEIYSFDNAIVNTPAGQVDGAVQALEATVQSLNHYSDLFGEYGAERFVVVQGDFPDGMEFSQLVFVSDAWFRTNPGTPESYLTIITVHEVSHQWWYARVGNDQALTPWLDEALATYSEYLFYEEFYPDLKDWWWGFRVQTFVQPGYSGNRVDSTVYEFATIREYINAVYLRGALMLDRLREALGTDVFIAWLRAYSDLGTERIVTSDDLWGLLSAEQLTQIAPIRAQFLSAS